MSGLSTSIRAIRSDDAPRLQALFDRLSPESAYLRFRAPLKWLSSAQAEFLANVDYSSRMALVTTVQEGGEERIIAVARYGALEEGEPGRAEFAIAVEDRYQGQGLGKALMRQLAEYAQQQGFTSLVGTVAWGNTRMLQFVRNLGLPCRISALARGELEVELEVRRPENLGSG